jgi:thiamine pyrophosphokinase
MESKHRHPSPINGRRDVLRTIIFSNGNFEHPEKDRSRIENDDFLIAADGGLVHCLALDMIPDLLIGDLDSVDSDLVKKLRERGTDIRDYPQRKDHTDLELALDAAMEHEPDEIFILAGLGGRWDQTLTNILLLSQPRFQGSRILLVDGPQQIEVISSGDTLEIAGQVGATVSLIPIHGPAQGIMTRGLEYELTNGTLAYGASRGVSNVLIKEHASVSLKEGRLVCIIIEPDYGRQET